MKPQPLIVRITAHIVGSKPDRDGMTELAELRDQVVIVTAERDRCHQANLRLRADLIAALGRAETAEQMLETAVGERESIRVAHHREITDL
jgi:hypothetical protein